MAHQHKRKDVLIVMQHAVRQNARAVYVKVTEKRLTTSEATELGVLRTLQLGLYLEQQIGVVSRNGAETLSAISRLVSRIIL
jgi:ABC-type polysaccharide/polyol phosphate transport system ATPase subunit